MSKKDNRKDSRGKLDRDVRRKKTAKIRREELVGPYTRGHSIVPVGEFGRNGVRGLNAGEGGNGAFKEAGGGMPIV